TKFLYFFKAHFILSLLYYKNGGSQKSDEKSRQAKTKYSMEYFREHNCITFWIIYLVLLGCIYFCDKKYGMLRDASVMSPRPFSFSRVQIAWWTAIVIAAFISTSLAQKHIVTLLDSTLYLLGISGATLAAASVVDTSDKQNPNIQRHQDLSSSENFILDILSDGNGVSIHRFQTVLFNLIFSVWFIKNAIHLKTIPDISENNLILLGLSSATYVGLKTTENTASTPSNTLNPPTTGTPPNS
ncbi:MAG TPA: hypothetical protein VKG26_05870, partial [Bacteroidia bacterium]|nr:hypothetical protein [Bacteroidia bacterium]